MFDTYAQITRKVSKHFYVTSNFIYFYLCVLVRTGVFFCCPFCPPFVLSLLCALRTYLCLLALIFDRLRNGYRCWVFVDWMILIFAGGGCWWLSLSFFLSPCDSVSVCLCIQGCDSNLDHTVEMKQPKYDNRWKCTKDFNISGSFTRQHHKSIIVWHIWCVVHDGKQLKSIFHAIV